ncbi:MAG: AAA family ATPase [Microbacterium sp.]|uniref:RNA polymerase recycling motor ATPase HelR n=1 Tax=Microbacterium sp. TaxID=51671 RepID=UPI001AC6CD1B|nr:RNA polymerase recycling motor ATPase HelR [Microbacterium sp.]MBN9177381.1 AAA family ATPase [Microbacterium sp.]
MPRTDDSTSAFALPERLHRKTDPALIADDEIRFAAIGAALADDTARTSARLDALRREPASAGQRALERDLEIRAESARLQVLRRFGLDACIGRMVGTDGTVTYIGRFGLAGDGEERLLTDWRAPASAPFFAASGADPMGLANRRRYRWRGGRVVDYWDEVFVPDGIDRTSALDDQSAFIASLGASRSPKMRDVLATIQSDQDAIIRTNARGALVVDGGPGTGKTVVALHRAAYLLYADARLQHGSGGLLFVGPHRPYVAYVDDVLPSLGEDGALVCALDDLVAISGDVGKETEAAVRRVKGDGRMIDAVEAAVTLWQRPPRRAQAIETAWGAVLVMPADWAEVFAEVDTMPHNALRSRAWERLLDLVEERIDDDRDGDRDPWAEEGFDAYGSGWDDDESVREVLENDAELRELFDRAWPLLDPDALLRGLLTSPDMLARCAAWMTAAEIAVITAAARDRDAAWTDADLPLLDAARLLVGDPRAEVRARRAQREAAEEKRIMSDVVTDLIAADDGDLRIMSMLRGQDLRRTLTDAAASPSDRYAGPFAHIVVDEAQELTDAQWRMLLRRCPSGSLTIVGDRAQARRGFAESWEERLARVGVARVAVATLTVNYRTPEEVMDAAGPVIRAVLPDANVPTSIRRTGVPVHIGRRAELAAVVAEWERESGDGTAVVVGAPDFAPSERVLSLDPVLVKGLEFDLVVLVDSERWGEGLIGAVDRYVAMTRATQRLVVLNG